ncbi:MAG: hypothetical protein QF682_01655 [Candidatus Thermoplasmatota archaeon]|nr:hypothetical protein [Candidatus Thermoplasmatota archaeon]
MLCNKGINSILYNNLKTALPNTFFKGCMNMKRVVSLAIVMCMVFGGFVIMNPMISTKAKGETPLLTITDITGTSGTITILYTTSDADNDNLLTCDWEYKIDNGQWKEIDGGAIENNDPKPPGVSSITWNTTFGTNNLQDIENLDIDFKMKVSDQKPFGTPQVSYNSPGGTISGLTWDGTNYYSCDIDTGKIYKHNTNDIPVSTPYNTPTRSYTGIAWDGTYLWSCTYEDFGTIYKHEMDSSLTVVGVPFSTFGNDPTAIAYDTINGCLYTYCMGTGKMYRHRASDPTIRADTYNTIGTYKGLTFDGAHLWAIAWNPNKIYKFTTTNDILQLVATFDTTSDVPGGLTHGENYLWCGDTVADKIHKLSNTNAISDFSEYSNFKIDNKAPLSPINPTADPSSWSSTNSFNLNWDNPNDLSEINEVYYEPTT